MSEPAIMEEEPEIAPVETPVTGLPSSTAADSDLDALLQEFQDKTAPKPELEPANEPDRGIPAENVSTGESLDQQIADLLGPDPKVAELTGQLNDLQAQIHRQEELKAFNEFADTLQKQMPSWLPEDYARVKLESLAHDPVARLAWETRSIDPKAAALDLAHVQFALKQTTDPKQIAELNKLAFQLNVAANSAAILRQARNHILNEAKKLPPPISEEATQIHDDVAWAVRQAQHGDIPEPQVDLGKLRTPSTEITYARTLT
jgi:hypothetical protein